ncbi:MAG: tetratricopeptide repeat protein [Myxococcota bacterium]
MARGVPLAGIAALRPDREALRWLGDHHALVLATLRSPVAPVQREDLLRVALVSCQLSGTPGPVVQLCERELAHPAHSQAMRIRLLNALCQELRTTRQRVDDVLAQLEALAADPTLEAGQQVSVLVEISICLREAGREAEALARCHRAVALGHDSQDPEVLASALLEQARADWGSEAAFDALRQVVALPLPADAWPRVMASANLGVMLHDAGRLDEAEVLYEEALVRLRGVAPTWWWTPLLSNLGNLASDRGDHEKAAAYLLEVAGQLGRAGYVVPRAIALLLRANTATSAGDPALAEARVREVLAEDPPNAVVAEAHTILGAAALHAGRIGAAKALLDVSVDRAEAEPPSNHGSIHVVWQFGAVVAAAAGDLAASEARHARARALDRLTPSRATLAYDLLTAGFAAATRARRGAPEAFDEASGILASLRSPRPPSLHWPEGEPPLVEGVRDVPWLVDRLAAVLAEG